MGIEDVFLVQARVRSFAIWVQGVSLKVGAAVFLDINKSLLTKVPVPVFS
jgi:hypothetical protein